MFFQDLIDILTEGFLELVISGYISIYQTSMETFAEKFSIIIGYASLILCSSVLLMIKYQSNNTDSNYEGGSAEKFSISKKIFNLFNEKARGNYWMKPSKLEYYFYFFTRRTLYMLIIFKYDENLQMTLLLLLNCFSFMYLGYRKPFHRSLYRLEVFNDFMVHIVSFHMIFFAGLELDKD